MLILMQKEYFQHLLGSVKLPYGYHNQDILNDTWKICGIFERVHLVHSWKKKSFSSSALSSFEVRKNTLYLYSSL